MTAPAQPVPPAAAPLGSSVAQAPAAPGRGRPLLPVQGVASLISRSTGEVLDLIEEGSILWAWDLAPMHGAARRFLRVLPACVECFQAGQECSLEWKAVLPLLLPTEGPELCGVELCRLLNVKSDTLYSLVRRRELEAISGWRPGPSGSVRLSTASFKAFLCRRRYPIPEAFN